MCPEIIIETPRFHLRRLYESDLAAFQRYRNDDDVRRYQDWQRQSDAEAAAYLAELSNADIFPPGKWFKVGIADRETGKLLGDIAACLSGSADEAEVGFALAREAQGRGVASEALGAMFDFLFTKPAIKRVFAVTDSRNSAAIALLQRLGMQRIKTCDAQFRGEPCKEHEYSLGRSQQ